MALAFLATITLGSLVLLLPVAHAPGVRVAWSDALFTATSAVTVTGLTTVDLGTSFSRFGQVVVLLLIHAGGLGIITLGVIAAWIVGGRVGFGQRLRVQAEGQTLHVGGVVHLVRSIALLALGVEALLVLAMWPGLAREVGALEGAWLAVFHAGSAFHNAGFSPLTGSLAGWLGNGVRLGAVLVGFIVGGLGYTVLIELGQRARGVRRHLSLHARIALASTAVLLAVGAGVVAVGEAANPGTLQGLPTGQRWLAAIFQGATPRTAGFSVLEVGDMRPATLAVTMLLMFIGGNPGSTAGGIKTVTFFVLAGSAWSLARGRGDLEVGGRRLGRDLLVRAGVVAFLGAVVVGAGMTALFAVESGRAPLALAFEAVSAFGTVGLSMGVTPELGGAAKGVLIVLMLVGRLGPLTAALALVETPRVSRVRRPAEDVMIG